MTRWGRDERCYINLLRLLKGAPPGQEAVNHYISELSIEKKNNSKLAAKERKHLTMLEVNIDFLGWLWFFLIWGVFSNYLIVCFEYRRTHVQCTVQLIKFNSDSDINRQSKPWKPYLFSFLSRLAMTSTSTTTSCSGKARAPTETWSSTLLRWWRTTSTRSGDFEHKDDVPHPGFITFLAQYHSLLCCLKAFWWQKVLLNLAHLVYEKIVYIFMFLWFCFIWLVV